MYIADEKTAKRAAKKPAAVKSPSSASGSGGGEDDSKVFAFLGVFLSVVGFVIVLLAKKDDKYAMHYGKQGLMLFFAYIAAYIIALIFAFVPVIGRALSTIVWILLLVLWIIGIVYSLSGKEKQIPLIGQYADMIKL